LLPGLQAAGRHIAPIALVRQARVAVADEVGQLLRARLVLILIGERPGLSSPDSLGAYLTWMPRVGRSDAERNCVSNIRPEGLACADAAAKLRYLLDEAWSRQLSGVALKDEAPASGGLAASGGSAAFLLPGR
jgi:ethanolamine ammonia-lyase small subunit